MDAYRQEVASGVFGDAVDEVPVDCIWGLASATELRVHYTEKLINRVDEFAIFLDSGVGRRGPGFHPSDAFPWPE